MEHCRYVYNHFCRHSQGICHGGLAVGATVRNVVRLLATVLSAWRHHARRLNSAADRSHRDYPSYRQRIKQLTLLLQHHHPTLGRINFTARIILYADNLVLFNQSSIYASDCSLPVAAIVVRLSPCRHLLLVKEAAFAEDSFLPATRMVWFSSISSLTLYRRGVKWRYDGFFSESNTQPKCPSGACCCWWW